MTRELIQVTPTVRVECGPVRRATIATAEVLDDRVTARHYQVGRRDALGKIIVLGEPMTYLDYRGPWGWHVYQVQPVMLDAEGRITDDPARGVTPDERYVEVGLEMDRADALELAGGLT